MIWDAFSIGIKNIKHILKAMPNEGLRSALNFHSFSLKRESKLYRALGPNCSRYEVYLFHLADRRDVMADCLRAYAASKDEKGEGPPAPCANLWRMALARAYFYGLG